MFELLKIYCYILRGYIKYLSIKAIGGNMLERGVRRQLGCAVAPHEHKKIELLPFY